MLADVTPIRFLSIAIAVIAAGSACFWFGTRDTDSRVAAPAPTASAYSAESSASTAKAPGARRDASTAASSTLATTDSATAHASEEIQLCGGDWVATDNEGGVDGETLFRLDSVQEARQATLAAMRSSPNELARATAIWLGAIEHGTLRDLALAAVSSADPQVYALAFSACYGRSELETSCGLLSAEQWARLAPGNARPWMYLLGDAVARRDSAARDEALYRIATSDRMDNGTLAAPASIIDSASHDDRSMLGVSTLVVEAIGMAFAWPIPYDALTKSCRVEARADANLWQTCSAVAELLVERSDDLLARSLGTTLGRRMDWPVERTDRLSAETARMQRALANETGAIGAIPDARIGTCNDIRRGFNYVRRVGTRGEVGTARQALASTPVTTEELTREGRQLRERREAPASAPVN